MAKEVLFTRTYLFTRNEDEDAQLKSKIIASLETLGLQYGIERATGYGTGTPTWIVTAYK